MNKEKFRFYKEQPKTCEPDDFRGQVKRTANGKSAAQEQVDMIVAAVVAGLELAGCDTLPDLCLGRDALSTLLFKPVGITADSSAISSCRWKESCLSIWIRTSNANK